MTLRSTSDLYVCILAYNTDSKTQLTKRSSQPKKPLKTRRCVKLFLSPHHIQSIKKYTMNHLIKKLVSFHTVPTSNPYGIPLDMSYITDTILVCSCPTTSFKSSFFHNTLSDLVHYLEIHHMDQWHIWNLRAELNDAYDVDDPLLRHKVTYTPWIDHQSPTFSQLEETIDQICEYLDNSSNGIAVIHCKHGKGRSGLLTIGVLMKKFKYGFDEANKLFTIKRMRPGFGEGVSILSQRRFARYIELSLRTKYEPLCPLVKIKSIRLIGCSNFDPLKIFLTASQLAIQLEDSKTFKYSGINPEHEGLEFIPTDTLLLPLDLKLMVQVTVSSKVPVPCTYAFICFNLFWETVRVSSNSYNHHYLSFTWDKWDGYKGLPKKGVQPFDRLELEWEYAR